MKSKTLAIRLSAAAVVIMVMAGICAGQTYWKRTYKGGAYAIAPTFDGNFFVVGWTSSRGAGSDDFYLLKINPYGDTVWTKTYGGKNKDQARAITSTSDGNFILAGYGSVYDDAYNVYLVKVTPDGDTIWTKTYGKSNNFASTIIPTIDRNFIICGTGFVILNSGSLSYGFLHEITPDGDTIWSNTYEAPVGGFNAISPAADGNFIVAGYTSPNASDEEYVYLQMIRPDGETMWTKTYGKVGGEITNGITNTLDGNFIFAGTTTTGVVGAKAVYLLKIKPDGDTIWTKTYGATDTKVANAIVRTLDGNFVVVGYISSLMGIPAQTYILKIKSNGDTIWSKTCSATFGDMAFGIVGTSDGNFIITGTTNYDSLFLLSLIDDRYAYKSTPFFFKIPVSGDSINHGYTPLKVPTGMTVSLGGTISWTPTTDSSYMDHVEFLVSDDMGKKDTLTFNIFVNSKNNPSKVINPATRSKTIANQSGISISNFSSYTSFTLSVPTGSLAIYDIHGRLIQNLSFTNNTAIWRGKIPAGRYFAKMTDSKRDVVKAFVVVR
jgi:hypothetical protein